MMTAVQKSRIINSYSIVLFSIIEKQENYNEILNELKNVFVGTEIEKNITPLELKEYNKVIKKILPNVDKNDDLQKFIYTILSRRYGCLIGEIAEMTKKILQNRLNLKKIKVISKNELNNHIKENIEKEIKKQIGEKTEITYEINRKLSFDEIEFVSKDNTYKISLLSLIDDVLKI